MMKHCNKTSGTRLTTKLVAIAVLVSSVGCSGFKPDQIVRHPDAPMLVTDAKGDWLRVSVYDRESNSLIDSGWLEAEETVGWTISKYDWESFITEQP